MSHYKPYPAYKDSGVEWLGRVPDHWVTKKLLYWISGYGSGTTPSSENEYSTEGLPWVTTGELRENAVFTTEKRVTHDALKNNSALKLHPAGSLVIAMYGATVGRLGVLGVEATLNQACFAIHPSESVLTSFLRNWFEGFRTELVGLATGAGQPNISGDKIRNLLIPCPQELSEQAAIITHLDHETVRIDALIEKKTRFIELLSEKRQALITHAVTKGLDPNVRMKDSGVEWLGEVPEHWKMLPLKRLISSIGQGWSPECEARIPEEGEWGVVKVGCVNGGVFRPEESKALPTQMEPRPELSLRAGDVLISRANTRELVGSCAVVPHDYPYLMLCDKLYRVGCGERVTPDFLAALVTVYGRRAVEIEATGASSSMVNIAQSVILDLLVAVPDADEQVEIISRVLAATTRIEHLREKTERSIKLLKERRSALIIAAVTGQIDLRETV